MKNDWLPTGARETLSKNKDAKTLIRCPIPGAARAASLDLSTLSKASRIDAMKDFFMKAGLAGDALDEAMSKNAPDDGGDFMQAWTLSTARIDSYKDSIDQNGWDLADYKRNPVVLFAHNSSDLPVGKDLGAFVDGGTALKGITRFTSKDLNPFGDTVGKLVKAGYLNATSVGFQPEEFEVAEERDTGEGWMPPINFKKQILREYSVVPVPANMDALAEGRSAGIDMSPIVKWAEKILDGEGQVWVPRSTIENVRRSALGDAPIRVRVAEGIDLAPTPKAAPGEPIVSEPVDPSGEGEPVISADDLGMCPGCGYEAKLSEFASPMNPTATDSSAEGESIAEPKAAGGGLPTPSVQSQDELKSFADKVALAAVREVQRQITERTGRLP